MDWMRMKRRILGFVPMALRILALSPSEEEGMDRKMKRKICMASETDSRIYSNYISIDYIQ